MLIRTILSGFGGQGVLSMGHTIAHTGMLEGKYVTYLPSYGVEVRGGTCNCTVVVSDEEIASPVASDPEFVVAMNQPSFVRFQSVIPSGGLICVNSSIVDVSSARNDIEVVAVPILQIGDELGTPKVANMVMLGALIGASDIISFDFLLDHLPEILGEGKAQMMKLNRKALERGFSYVKE